MYDPDGANCEPAPYPVADLLIPPGVPLREIERRAYEVNLAATDGNRTQTAKALGVTVRTVQRKIRAWGEHPSTEGVKTT